MNVTHVIPHINEKTSGPSYSVVSLCEALAARNVNVSLHTAFPGPTRTNFSFNLNMYPDYIICRGLHYPRGMLTGLRNEASHIDIIHNHGLWLCPNLFASWVAKEKRCKLFSAPRGNLAQWPLNNRKIAKIIMWRLFQQRALALTDCFHATSEAEYIDIRRAGFSAPVSIIPNGIDIPDMKQSKSNNIISKRQLLFLARIHPVKGVEYLIRAWRSIQTEFLNWELKIVGPDNEGHLEFIKNLCCELGVERVVFCGPVYDIEKSRTYSQADLYVLPTHSENFGITIAEALSHCLPIITTKGAPWEGLEANNCGWWIDVGVEPLIESLKIALAESPEKLKERGKRGRAWMERDFSWAEVGRKMVRTYEWILDGGEVPGWVRLD